MTPHCATGVRGHAAIALLALLAMLAGAGAVVRANGQGQTVEQLEASIVLTFARFVEWPPAEFRSDTAPIVVGIVGDEAVAAALETVSRGKNVAGRTIAVKRLQWDSDSVGVHMLFVGDSVKRHLAVVLEQVRSRPVVTVSRLPDFGRGGGMITLTVNDGRLSFAVNSHATSLSAVRLSSFLLSHATKVSDGSGPGGW
jgi:hypothetical protein